MKPPKSFTDALDAMLYAAFLAGERLGQENAKHIERTTYPKQDPKEAAAEYAKNNLQGFVD